MIIHIIRKFADKLQKTGYSVPDKTEAKPCKLGDWHADVTTSQRRQRIVFTHDQTRFTVALKGVTLKEVKELG